ncbi:MAG: hypothetical protein GTN93_26480, partial [Anaerolineae bacterium]|nr:hypothetical protein [Anaerolineae bacterium]
KEAIAASTWYILVDKDDDTNYGHEPCGVVNLLKLILNSEKASTGIYDVWVGVVRENDGTDGSADFVAAFHIEAIGNPTDNTDRCAGLEIDFTTPLEPRGLSCAVVGDRLRWFKSDSNSGDVADLANDAASLDSAAGGSGKSAEVGDVVVWVEEVTGSGTLDLALMAVYCVS